MHQADTIKPKFYAILHPNDNEAVIDLDWEADPACEMKSDIYLSVEHADSLPLLNVKTISLGTVVDFNRTPNSLIVVSERLTKVMTSVASNDIQIGPVNCPLMGEWSALRVSTVIDCIDHRYSRCQYFGPFHSRAFEIRGVLNLCLDETRIPESASVFRTVGWGSTLIVRAGVADELLRAGFTGFNLKAVQTSMEIISTANRGRRICPLCQDIIQKADDCLDFPKWFIESTPILSGHVSFHKECFLQWSRKCQHDLKRDA